MYYLLALIAVPHVTWLIYTAVMRLMMVRALGLLTPAMKVFAYPWLAVGLALDFLTNIVLGTVVMLEAPREWTLSARLWRLSNEGTGYRQKWAIAIRAALLDAIDPSGTHRG